MNQKEKNQQNIVIKMRNQPFFKQFFLVVVVVLISVFVTKMSTEKNNLKSRETLIEFNFKDVGNLVVQEFRTRVMEDSSKDRKIFDWVSIPFTESRLIFSIDVEVLSSIDFEKITYDIKQRENKDIIEITLPHAVLYKAYEVPNSFKSYLDSESWFTNISSSEQQKLKDQMVEKGKQEAISLGLLEKADKYAKILITNMVLSNAKTKSFEVEFKYK